MRTRASSVCTEPVSAANPLTTVARSHVRHACRFAVSFFLHPPPSFRPLFSLSLTVRIAMAARSARVAAIATVMASLVGKGSTGFEPTV
eukprot:jgi/Pico_ML_1/54991/g117.t1